MNEENKVSQRIKKIRKALNLKQKDFAQRLGISGGSLSEVEKGKYPPNFEFLRKLSRDYNVNLYYIFFGEGDMFLEPGQGYSKKLDGLAAKNEDLRKFLYYFEQSAIFRYIILSTSEEVLIENGPKIKKEIETKSRKDE